MELLKRFEGAFYLPGEQKYPWSQEWRYDPRYLILAEGMMAYQPATMASEPKQESA